MKRADKLLSFGAVALLLLLAGCDKPKDFNLDTTMPGAHFNVKDTSFPVDLVTEVIDSSRASNLSVDLIGSLNDPELGATDANMYFQLRLLELAPHFGGSPQADSAVLFIPYAGPSAYSGDATQQQTWNLYSIAEDLNESRTYYTVDKINVDQSEKLATYKGRFSPADSVLRIKFSSMKYANSILQDPDSSTDLIDNSSFVAKFKGLAIMPDHSALSGTGAILHFLLNNAETRLRIYYHRNNNASDTASFSLGVSDASVRVNTFSHNYSSNATSRLGKTQQDRAYVQAMSGLRTKVILPAALKDFAANETVALHRAELILPEFTNSSSIGEVKLLGLAPRDANGTNESTNAEFNQSYIDGTFTDFGGGWRPAEKYYNFVITHHIQNILGRYAKKPDYSDNGMNLYPTVDNPVSSGRTILNSQGSSSGAQRPYIRLTYTKIASK